MSDLSSTSTRTLFARLTACAGLFGALGPVLAEPMVGLTSGGSLITFDSATPGVSSAPIPITGLQGGVIVGIDLRPSTGVLYGVSNLGGLYTLDATTGAATFIGVAANPVAGQNIGIDFNPVPDLAGSASLRLTGTLDGQNRRVNVNAGMIGTTVVDGSINGAATSFGGLAYTNNDRDPLTGTALYGIGGGNLYQVTNPNGGASMLIGSLGVPGSSLSTADNFVGFDVSGLTGTPFATFLNAQDQSGFYSVNLGTGAASLIGMFNASAVGVMWDVSAAMPASEVVAAVPEPETYAMMLLGLAGMGWAARRRRR